MSTRLFIISKFHTRFLRMYSQSIGVCFCYKIFHFAFRSTKSSLLTCYASDSCAGTNLSTRSLLPLQMLAAAYLSRVPFFGPSGSGPYRHFSGSLLPFSTSRSDTRNFNFIFFLRICFREKIWGKK